MVSRKTSAVQHLTLGAKRIYQGRERGQNFWWVDQAKFRRTKRGKISRYWRGLAKL